jgi:hypothetical protein
MMRWRLLVSKEAVSALESNAKEMFSVARARAKMEREVFMRVL